MVDSFDSWFSSFKGSANKTERCAVLAQSFDVMFDHYTLDAAQIVREIGVYWYDIARFLPAHAFAVRLNRRATPFAGLLGEHLFYFAAGLKDSAIDRDASGQFAKGLGMFAGDFLSSSASVRFFEGLEAMVPSPSSAAVSFFSNIDGHALAHSAHAASLVGVDDECICAIASGRTAVLAVLDPQRAGDMIADGLAIDSDSAALSRLVLNLARARPSPLAVARLINTSPAVARAIVQDDCRIFTHFSDQDWSDFGRLLMSPTSLFEAARTNPAKLAMVLRNHCASFFQSLEGIPNVIDSLRPVEDSFLRNIAPADLMRLSQLTVGPTRAKVLQHSISRHT